MIRADIHEIFASIQGEGTRIGERHIFVRFLGCDMLCRYCDTPAAVKIGTAAAMWKGCKVQTAPGSNESTEVPNPVSPADLTSFCTRLIIPGPSRPMISLTGGEPLLHQAFLAEWLPSVRPQFGIYLETNGVHVDGMRDLYDLVDIVSMDFKLPSATGLSEFWEEHKRFLSAARGKTLLVKTVVTHSTTQDEMSTAVRIIAEFDKSIPLIIQPADGEFAPVPSMLLEFQDEALRSIEDVRVIPQAHKIMMVP